MEEIKGTITRRLESALDDLENEFKSLCDRRDFENKLAALKKAEGRSDWPSKLSGLYEMFDVCGISYERGREYAYYERLVKESDIPSFKEIEGEMLLALYEKYRTYPSPEDYMKRMVDRLCNEKDGWENDTLRLRILKQFIKYGNYLKDVKLGQRKKVGGGNAVKGYVKDKTGKKKVSDTDVIEALDDGVFDLLKDASREQKQPDGKYGLLKICDDLAEGKFRTGGSTKRFLYLFAIVYNMTFYSGADTEIQDFDSDIEVNLFRDYYVNNLIRFITDASRENLSEYELDPSGQGINYKNFAEMVYLYYIAKPNGEMSPGDKIKKASEMILALQGRENGNVQESAGTAVFRNYFKKNGPIFSDDALKLDEEHFEEFIVGHYNCDTKNSGQDVGVFQLSTEQKSAFVEYEAVLTVLIKELRKNEGEDEENFADYDFSKLGEREKKRDRKKYLWVCNYGLWFADVPGIKESGLRADSLSVRKAGHGTADIDEKKWNEFINLLIGMNRFIGYTSAPGSAIRALSVTSETEMTRTSLIIAWYYYFNAYYEKSDEETKIRFGSFEEVFNEFKAGVDPYLEAAYYQPFSGRNLFDVLTAFSSYAYINL